MKWNLDYKLHCDNVYKLDKHGRYRVGWHIDDKLEFRGAFLRVFSYQNPIGWSFCRFGNALVSLHSRGICNCLVLSGFWVVLWLEVA